MRIQKKHPKNKAMKWWSDEVMKWWSNEVMRCWSDEVMNCKKFEKVHIILFFERVPKFWLYFLKEYNLIRIVVKYELLTPPSLRERAKTRFPEHYWLPLLLCQISKNSCISQTKKIWSKPWKIHLTTFWQCCSVLIMGPCVHQIQVVLKIERISCFWCFWYCCINEYTFRNSANPDILFLTVLED